MSRFFRILDDVHARNRWHLHNPCSSSGARIDPWQFTKGQVINVPPAPLRIPLQYEGTVLDFTFAGFEVPVLSTRAQEILQSVISPSELQLIPVIVDGAPSNASFAILNVTHRVVCIDESKSQFMKWTKADNRADLLGSYRMVTRLVIRPDGVKHDLFRIFGWEGALIASSAVADALRAASITGITFEPVSD